MIPRGTFHLALLAYLSPPLTLTSSPRASQYSILGLPLSVAWASFTFPESFSPVLTVPSRTLSSNARFNPGSLFLSLSPRALLYSFTRRGWIEIYLWQRTHISLGSGKTRPKNVCICITESLCCTAKSNTL